MDEPELGGVPKSREFHGREHIHELRERWADDLNGALERNYEREYERAHEHTHDYTHEPDRDNSLDQPVPEWVDHRSYQDQGIDRAPGMHLGPGIYAALEKGQEPERYLRHQEIQHEIQNIERELEHVREFARDDQERVEERQLDHIP